jgi:hypothetical protein
MGLLITPAGSAATNAAGSDTQVQFNDGGTNFGGDADLTWAKSTNTMTLGGTDTGIVLQKITNVPSAPSSGLMRLYSQQIAARQLPMFRGPTNLPMPVQPGLWLPSFKMWVANANGSGGSQVFGGTWTVAGTDAKPNPSTTNIYTTSSRQTKASVVTTANQQVGLRLDDQSFFRSNTAGQGGFFFACKFGTEVWTAGDRLFVGLASAVTALVTGQPSAVTNMLGFAIDASDTAITFMHNDGSGTATKDTIAGQPSLASNQGYIGYIFMKPNDSTIYYRLDDLNAGTIIIDTSVATDVVAVNTNLKLGVVMGNAANTVAGNATIGISSVYCETDV